LFFCVCPCICVCAVAGLLVVLLLLCLSLLAAQWPNALSSHHMNPWCRVLAALLTPSRRGAPGAWCVCHPQVIHHPSSQPALAGEGGGCSPSGRLSLAAFAPGGWIPWGRCSGQASLVEDKVDRAGILPGPQLSQGIPSQDTQDSTRRWQQATSAVQVNDKHTLGQLVCLAPLWAPARRAFWLQPASPAGHCI